MELLENGVVRLKGEVWMKLGVNLTREQVLKNPDRHDDNLIVDICSELIAQWAFAGDNSTEHIPGIISLAVGTGGSGWDIQNPPVETSDLEFLYSELARTYVTKAYIDNNGEPTVLTRTNKIEFTAMFDFPEANGPIVEMGLFGGANALVANSGTRINAKHFPVLNKTPTSQLTLMWKLVF